MNNGKNLKSTMLLGLLMMTLLFPLVSVSALTNENQVEVQATLRTEGGWTYIQNDMITIVFPAGGKKPMFLWWYTKDPQNINVVKYKGLYEYVTFDQPYFLLRSQAEAPIIRERLQMGFFEPRRHMMQNMQLGMALQLLSSIGNYSGLHRPFLPFSGATWELSAPVNVTQGDVKYLAFNFTLKDIPSIWPNLQFAEGNIIIRCRFYYTPATIDVDGKYSYAVEAGEFKMDFVVSHWEWNIDKLKPLIQQLEDYLDIDIPETKTGLALWINLASINMTDLQTDNVESDAAGVNDTGVEATSMTQNMYVEGEKTSVAQNLTTQDTQPMPNRLRERFKFRFEKGNATLAGFFKFVPQALLRDPTNQTVLDVVDVTASYVAAGAHMRVYIGYPYFGNLTLEHDPSIGLETLPTLATYQLILALLGIATIVAIAVLVVRWKRGPVNVLRPK